MFSGDRLLPDRLLDLALRLDVVRVRVQARDLALLRHLRAIVPLARSGAAAPQSAASSTARPPRARAASNMHHCVRRQHPRREKSDAHAHTRKLGHELRVA